MFLISMDNCIILNVMFCVFFTYKINTKILFGCFRSGVTQLGARCITCKEKNICMPIFEYVSEEDGNVSHSEVLPQDDDSSLAFDPT
jgi:hypothetical protein